jgi:hypothetical protein
MTLCPIALIAGCRKCPAFEVCPLKSVIGDYQEPDGTKPNEGSEKAQAGDKTDK